MSRNVKSSGKSSGDCSESIRQSWLVKLPWPDDRPEEINERIYQNVLGRLRSTPGVSIGIDQQTLWIRGDQLDDRLSRQLRSIPDAERFRVLEGGGQLAYWDESVPREFVPDVVWRPLVEWMELRLPVPAFVAEVQETVSVSLVRAQEVQEANWMMTEWGLWRDYAIPASQIRLNRWSFAVSSAHEVIVRGTPLPPIPGRRFIERQGIAILSGWRTDPPLQPNSLRAIWKVSQSDIVIWNPDRSPELISESAFVRATRSAIRQTAAKMMESSGHG